VSFFGLILQIGLLFLLFKLVMGFIRGSGFSFQGAGFGARPSAARGSTGAAAGGTFAGFGGPHAGPWRETKLEPSQSDFAMFEQRLAEIQSAFSAEDLNQLRALATLEMASYFAEELAANSGKGQVNKISDVKFLQGDLSEAWREPNAEFATVAMRFSLTDNMVGRTSGRIVSGDPQTPQLVAEVWTFRRPPGGAPSDWKLSAIQQAR
jgi:predicted lipid-binding transport protein (Tim44 family)